MCLPSAPADWLSNEWLPVWTSPRVAQKRNRHEIQTRSALAVSNPTTKEELMTIIIGIDPHKASHTAVAIGCDEQQLAEIRVRATCQQTEQLLAWAKPLGPRTWAVESAGGLGYLLSQQLVGAGERVLDVPANPGLEGAGTRHRTFEQERPQRCAVGGHRRPPLSGTAFGRAGQSHGSAPPPGQAEPRARQTPQYRCVTAPCCLGQPLTRRNLQGTQRF